MKKQLKEKSFEYNKELRSFRCTLGSVVEQYTSNV